MSGVVDKTVRGGKRGERDGKRRGENWRWRVRTRGRNEDMEGTRGG